MYCSSQFFLSLGVITFLYYLYECLKSPLQLLYYQWLEIQGKAIPLTEKFGKWAAITGSTDGIGKAYARELAHKGFNIVLVARNEEKLKETADDIAKEFGVEVYTIKADFSHGPAIYDKLFQDLAKKPIRLLVNNVGIGHNPPGITPSFTAEHLWDVIYVNLGAATQLSRHFVDLWLKQGISGCVVNISSMLEGQPAPYGAVYGATKAYLRSFTTALQHEVQSFGITIQLLSPGAVATKINSYSAWCLKGNLLVPTAEVYAKWAVNTLGKCDQSTGYIWHAVHLATMKWLPTFLRIEMVKMLVKAVTDDTTNIYEASIRKQYGQL
ncbi:inactive hydroxysteroid dehydrogenase-like protein 1 [Musca vetustissima]|uniref:inactive hydroxysteroid dehydrogenase-like protein 1 n=1 Tax=Musca vetustissima TaxID=27455 RepID=UPI002AB6315B|nr:inactive hydroxysteroid dehydrogenase-like protein 1 [Musca vetustissima]